MPDAQVQAALQVLERAMCLQVDGEAFYRQAAARAADAAGNTRPSSTSSTGRAEDH